MYSQLGERIRLMRARLDSAAPVAEIRAEFQFSVAPVPICDRLVTLAGISNRDYTLEPSAGTGAILRMIRGIAPVVICDVVGINSRLVRCLWGNFNGVRVQCGDSMEWQLVQYYSQVIMNPPFSRGQDIRYILRAFSLLRPGGVLVVVCLNGLRQREKLLPLPDVREGLLRDTFAYTDVPTMIIRPYARRLRVGGRISVRLPASGKDRAPVVLKGAAFTCCLFHYTEILLWASILPDLSFVCYW